MNPAFIRAVESAVTTFVVTFVTVFFGVWTAADLSDRRALETAAINALLMAAVAAAKQLSNFTALDVKPSATTRR